MRSTMQTVTNSDIVSLNTDGHLGIMILSKCLHRSPNTIQKILGHSSLSLDVHQEINKVYNAQIPDSQIDYFIDGTQAKLRCLKTHDRGRLSNFPKVFIVANKNGNIVSYETFTSNSLNETSLEYDQTIIKAKLPKGSIIHVDIYSIQLFKLLEEKGFIPCHKNKRTRSFPYYHQVEHLFSNYQKVIRRFKRSFLTNLNKNEANDLTIALLNTYLYHDLSHYLDYIKNKVVKVKELQIALSQ